MPVPVIHDGIGGFAQIDPNGRTHTMNRLRRAGQPGIQNEKFFLCYQYVIPKPTLRPQARLAAVALAPQNRQDY
jgi:hypothetical protein